MDPIITIVGRPNVGKSTLFNCLTKSRNALVADIPGLTRDRQYGHIEFQERGFIVVDTGGLSGNDVGIDAIMAEQVHIAIAEADVILLLVDGREGLVAVEENLLRRLRALHKPIVVVVNKTDGIEPQSACAEFYQLGLEHVIPIAASHQRGIQSLMELVVSVLPPAVDVLPDTPEEVGIKVAIVGRPNVGKSTLVNRILGEERVVVFDQPGSTCDSIYIPFERFDKRYTIIDTAGVKRKGKTITIVEKFSVVKTLQAIREAHVVVLLLDATLGVVDQDLSLIGLILEAGRGLIVAINKWDGLDEETKARIYKDMDRRLLFLDFVKFHKISALHGTGVGDLFASINKVYESAHVAMTTSRLTRILESALMDHSPPLVRGRRIKLRLAHPGGHNPPVIVIHGNQLDHLPTSYIKYLENTYRQALKLIGTPLRIVLQNSKNPFAGIRNELTERQQRKRRRLLKSVKRQ